MHGTFFLLVVGKTTSRFFVSLEGAQVKNQPQNRSSLVPFMLLGASTTVAHRPNHHRCMEEALQFSGAENGGN